MPIRISDGGHGSDEPRERAARNSDGVVFYKIWNGRAKPKMPAQKDELTKDQVWQIVAYAQTLRKK